MISQMPFVLIRLRVTFIVLPFLCDLMRAFDVASLARFVSSAEKQDQASAVLQVVDPVARAMIDA